jgi:hypothetical protein
MQLPTLQYLRYNGRIIAIHCNTQFIPNQISFIVFDIHAVLHTKYDIGITPQFVQLRGYQRVCWYKNEGDVINTGL